MASTETLRVGYGGDANPRSSVADGLRRIADLIDTTDLPLPYDSGSTGMFWFVDSEHAMDLLHRCDEWKPTEGGVDHFLHDARIGGAKIKVGIAKKRVYS